MVASLLSHWRRPYGRRLALLPTPPLVRPRCTVAGASVAAIPLLPARAGVKTLSPTLGGVVKTLCRFGPVGSISASTAMAAFWMWREPAREATNSTCGR